MCLKTAGEAHRRTNDMKKILGLAIIGLMALSSIAFCYKKYKCYSKMVYIIFKDKFTEPIEILYLLASDGTLYKITSHHEDRISFDMKDLKKALKKNGHKISDIIIIIHNHPPNTPRDFSLIDIHTWYEFKNEGFTGNFYLYPQGSGVIYELREDDDDS